MSSIPSNPTPFQLPANDVTRFSGKDINNTFNQQSLTKDTARYFGNQYSENLYSSPSGPNFFNTLADNFNSADPNENGPAEEEVNNSDAPPARPIGL